MLVCGRFEDCHFLENVDLIVSSPPYGIGKEYEKRSSISDYKTWAEVIVQRLAKVTRTGSVVCWQVGNYVHKDGSVMPLDVLFIPLFLDCNFRLINRIIWRFGHGLHASKKLSGRYETLLCFVKGGGNFTFNLDEVRTPAKYPGKRSYKGEKKGQLSGNPLGTNPGDVWDILASEWDSGVMDIPPVKSNHIEKTIHPCQFPVELAERCVLLFSKVGDIVLDPFGGTGTVAVSAQFHQRCGVSIEMNEKYHAIALERLKMAQSGELRTRALGKAVHEPDTCSALARIPEEWKEIQSNVAKKPRLVSSPFQEIVALKTESARNDLRKDSLLNKK